MHNIYPLVCVSGVKQTEGGNAPPKQDHGAELGRDQPTRPRQQTSPQGEANSGKILCSGEGGGDGLRKKMKKGKEKRRKIAYKKRKKALKMHLSGL